MKTIHAAKKSAGHSNRVSTQPFASSPIAMIRKLAIVLGCSSGFGLLILLLCTFIAYRSSDPVALLSPLSLVALYLTAIFIGMISVRVCSGTAPLIGLTAGILLLLAGALIGICIPSDYSTSQNGIYTFLFRLPVPVLTILSACISQRHPQKSIRRKHR